MEIKKISGTRIDEVLFNNDRQYLAGNLKRPQELEFIRTEKVEIGISDFKAPIVEAAHFHPISEDYSYALKGSFEVIDNDAGKKMIFNEGDLCCIPPGVCHTFIITGSCRILFVKVPSTGDKTICEKHNKKERDE